MRRIGSALGLGAVLGLVIAATPSDAITYNYIQIAQGCSDPGCTVDSNNTVQVSDTTEPNGTTALAAGLFDVLVTLDTGWTFQKQNGNGQGHEVAFGFSTSVGAITLSNIVPDANFTVQDVGSGFSLAPWDFPATGYGVVGAVQNAYSSLGFRIDTHSSLTLAQFIATLLPGTANTYADVLFAADVSDPGTGNTGSIGFGFDGITTNNAPPPAVPLPLTAPLLASGLGALGLLRLANRRKPAA